MYIRKTQQPAEYPGNNIYDAYNTSTTDTYSCNYINDLSNGSAITYTDYITFASGVTVNSCTGYKVGKIVYILYDINATLATGANVIGSVNVSLFGGCYGAARFSTSGYTSSLPASVLALSNGNLRLHCSTSGVASAGTIILVLS